MTAFHLAPPSRVLACFGDLESVCGILAGNGQKSKASHRVGSQPQVLGEEGSLLNGNLSHEENSSLLTFSDIRMKLGVKTRNLSFQIYINI